jgi:hypothetical protein
LANFRESPECELGWIAHSSGPIVITNFVECEFHEVRSESRYEGLLFSPSSARPLLCLLSQF